MPAVGRTIALVGTLVVALAVAGSSWAAFPGADGRIAFSRSVGNGFDYDIYSMRVDGTGRREIVGSRFVDLEPSYSSNGRVLVFTRDVDERRHRANDEIFAKSLGSGEVVRLTNHPAIDWNAVLSFDGSLLAFSSDRGPGHEFDIFLLDLETDDLTRVPRPGDDFSPAFTPDGLALVWSGYRPNGRADIFFETFVGGGPQNLTGTLGKSEEEPNVDPSSTRIVYQRWGKGGAAADPEIVTRVISSGVTTVLTRNRISDIRPAFSPRGSRIVWERTRDGTDTSSRIWTMRANGSKERAKTPRRFDADSPDWQPRP